MREQPINIYMKPVITALIIPALLSFSGCAGLWPGNSVRQPEPKTKPRPETESSGANTADGEYEGKGRGYRGEIRLRVRMAGGAIAEIEILESSEDSAVGGAAMEELLELALLYNTADLDTISGATETSKGFLEALENAMLGP
jgi:uncharacterized protein with FMN-binding domain